MRHARPTLRQLYPDATIDRALRTHRPPRLGIPARSWSTFIGVVIAIFVVSLVGVWLLERATSPEQVNRWFGGSGVVSYASDGDAQTLEGTWLKPLLFGMIAIVASTYGLLRLALKPPWRQDGRVSWADWAAERGFAPASTAALPATACFSFLNGGDDRDWHGPWRGRIGGHEAFVGATAWSTGSGRSRERHHCTFAVVELDPEVARQFEATSLTHLLRGFTDFGIELGIGESEELRLESIAVDLNCEILVGGAPGDDPRWRQLFDAPLVAALAEALDVQWVQRGRVLVCCAGGSRIGSAPSATLDTLCTGAEFLARWFEHVARRRAAGERLEARGAA